MAWSIIVVNVLFCRLQTGSISSLSLSLSMGAAHSSAPSFFPRFDSIQFVGAQTVSDNMARIGFDSTAVLTDKQTLTLNDVLIVRSENDLTADMKMANRLLEIDNVRR